jgi:RES domain-containing protein
VTGARWNSPGRPTLYTSSFLSLSVLEAFVHLPGELRDDLPELEAISIQVPEDAGTSEVTSKQFDKLMAAPDPFAACQAIGDQWLARGVDLILKAPSVLVPEELNFMINPLHPEMRRVRIVSSRRFRFDPRLARPV